MVDAWEVLVGNVLQHPVRADPSPGATATTGGEPTDLTAGLITLPQALQQMAEARPDAPALHVVDTDDTRSWAQFADDVLTAAAGLDHLGVRPGDRVGILLSNGVEFPVSWLAILATGAVAVPMNPRYTAREIAFIAEDTGMGAVIASTDLAPVLGDLPARLRLRAEDIVWVGDEPPVTGVTWSHLTSGPRWEQPCPSGRPSDLANIQYTSGTTGLPKGCMLTHEYWMLLARVSVSLRRGESRNTLADHPFFYLQNQAYLASALITGAQLHITPGLSLRRYIGWLNDHDIDSAWMSDALLSLPPTPGDTTHKLRFVPTDGISPELHAQVEERFGVCTREWYASTEVGLAVISPWDDASAVGSGSLGYPAPLRETRLLDGSGAAVPPGGTGELCVRGPGMMLGYWNRPAVNAESFLPGGWFRTGDLVRIDPDGQHFFIGRVKDMVRRSGENIAAVEVEQQLEAHPAVQTAAVIPVPDDRRGEEIKALIVLVPGRTVTPGELADWCRDRLAPYKLPRYVAFRDDLPLTSSGKVAKAQLRAEHADLRTGAHDLVDDLLR